jgi:pentatricopeptide repeat protein
MRDRQANEVLRSMKSAGVSPNVHTYTSLLKGAARSGDLDQMMDIFQAMMQQVRRLIPAHWEGRLGGKQPPRA